MATKRFDLFTFLSVTVLFFAACFAALYMPAQAARGVRSGVESCLTVLLPSLFPFMFLSAFAVEYGIAARLGRIFAPFAEKILYLPAEAAVTVFLSLVGGYPVGAVGVASLLKSGRITPKQAARMLCFCLNPGPAFLISTVGEGLFGSKTAGVVILAAQTVSSLLIGIAAGLLARSKEPIEHDISAPITRRDLASSFVLAARGACASSVSMCSLVVLFSAFSSLFFAAFGFRGEVGAVLRCVLEVTDGCATLSKLRMPVYFAAAAVGWGGICVHFQVFAAVPELSMSKTRFFFARIAAMALSGLLTFGILRYLDIDIEAFSAVSEPAAAFSSSTYLGSAALLLSSVMFLLFIGDERLQFERMY